MKKRPFAVWFFSVYIFLFSLGAILEGMIKGSLEREVLISCLMVIGLAIWLFKPSIFALRIVQLFLIFCCVGAIISTFGMFFKQELEVNLQTVIKWIVVLSFFGAPLIYSLRNKTENQFKNKDI